MNESIPRERSKYVFGNRYMLEVCVRIAESDAERVSLTSLLGNTALSPSVYSAPLRRLALGELICDLGHDESDHKTRWYSRQDSSFWATAIEIAEASPSKGQL